MIWIICVVGGLSLLAGWEAFRWRKRREDTARRRERLGRGAAKQKAWDVVFGRRRQRRLSYQPDDEQG